MGTHRSWLVPLAGLVGGGITGCAAPSIRYADVQLDITGSNLVDTDRIRICVDGFRVFEEALGAGTISVPGLPNDTALSVIVDHLTEDERLGRAGPVLLDQAGSHVSEPWKTCTGDCPGCTIEDENHVSSDESERLLTIRFLD